MILVMLTYLLKNYNSPKHSTHSCICKKANKKVFFDNCASFADSLREINNTQIDNAKDIDVVMSMYNLIEYRDNYSITSGSLW